jgi:hypothetical protein
LLCGLFLLREFETFNTTNGMLAGIENSLQRGGKFLIFKIFSIKKFLRRQILGKII